MLLTTLGTVVLAVTAYDVFRSLFDPAGSGALDAWVQHGIWRVAKALRRPFPSLIVVAGPLAFVGVIVTWVALVVLGYTLVYYPWLEHGFVSLQPHRALTFGDALAISSCALVAQATDVLPSTTILKVVWSGESMFGVVLLTSTVSFIVSIYPILERRRSFAHHVSLLRRAQGKGGSDVLSLPVAIAFDIIMELALKLEEVRSDLADRPITYYFVTPERMTSLPCVFADVRALANAAAGSREDELRLAGEMLAGAVKNYLQFVAKTFLRMPADDQAAVLNVYRREQGCDVV